MAVRSVAIWMYQNDNGHIPLAQLSERLIERGIEVYSDFDMRHCHVLNGLVYDASGVCLSEFDVLFHMNADEQSYFQQDVLQAIENSGVKVVNDCTSFFQCKDKFAANTRLRQHGVRVPEAVLLGPSMTRECVDNIFLAWGSLVYKPRSGHGAVGVIRFADAEGFWDFFQATKSHFSDYYLERFIDFGDSDLRVEILDGKVLGGYSRMKQHSFKTNISSGGKMMPTVIGVEAEVALAAAKALGINGTIVDMVESRVDGQIYVLEVNPLLGIFVESAMRAGTKMPVTEPHPGYSYDSNKIDAIVAYIESICSTESVAVAYSG